MFTNWRQVEDWIRDNGLVWWRFTLDPPGSSSGPENGQTQTRSNKVVVLSDAFPGDLEEKLILTKKRLEVECNHVVYGQGKRGKENTGLMYCEVRLVDCYQQPGTHAVSSPSYPSFDKDELVQQIRKEVQLEFENQRYREERKAFETEKKAFEQEKNSTIGFVVQQLSPVITQLLGKKQVAGIDADAPVAVKPIQQTVENTNSDPNEDYPFTDEEADKMLDLMKRFKKVEPMYLDLLERVVVMAETGDKNYEFARKMLL